ncbi:MAG: TonB-dependent receptor plug domain-containing protein [Desulfurellaceae bacterium]|nr:TonB-dependent receptor plug domain-containing protein [Desulfurellaceae bacterium]
MSRVILLPGEKCRAVRRLCGWAWCVVVLLWAAGLSYGQDTSGRQEAGRVSAEATQRMPLITVTERRPISAATETRVRENDFAVRPHNTASEMLNNLPGFVAGQHAGGGKAMQYFLRGFDNDHGTDVAISVDGIPVNMVSHAHGQGYADLNFLIPEVVESIDYRKGPYFADSGNFANSGSVNFITKDDTVENSLRAVGGSFNTMRYVGILSPRLGPVQSLIANEVYFTDGPSKHGEHFVKYNFFGKFTLRPNPRSKLSLWTSLYTGDWDASGQIPLREVNSGRLDRFGSLDPSEGGRSDRENVNLIYTATPSLEKSWSVQLYFSRYRLRMFSNFTFFSGDPVRGDGIEQLDTRVLFGGRAQYRRMWTLGGMLLESSLGFETRNDNADVGLFRQQRRQRFSTTQKVEVWENAFSGYTQHELFLREWLRFIVGLRGDFFVFDVDGRSRPGATDAPQLQGDATDGIVSPKASLIVSPFTDPASLWHQTDLFLNFGMGYHSNDARDAVQPGGSGLARSSGAEIGARTNLYNRIELAASLWWLDLGSELVFVGDEGTTEQRGPTRRWGVDAEVRAEVLPWLLLDYDLTYADPRFRVTGEAIPLAPTLLMNGGLTAYPAENLSAALRVRFLDDRAANEDRSVIARGYSLIDLLLRYRWRNIELSFDVLNLADTDWRETQFATESCVRRELGRDSRCPRRGGGPGILDTNVVSGYGINVRGGLTVFF